MMQLTNPPSILLLPVFLFLIFSTQIHTSLSAIVVGTWFNVFQKAIEKAAGELSVGKSSLDAVEVACRTCQELQCGETVGFGGSPDEAGETTLDAMIMDGTTMNIGAVGALRRIKDAVGVARKVLENTQHTLLVGDQATNFAIKMGFAEEPLSTANSKNKWKTWRDKRCQPNFWMNVKPDPKTSCGPYKPKSFINRMSLRSNNDISEYNHDTIGVVAVDNNGHVAAATSTNGANHKIPGRVGDSPIPGAGAYAETGIGAAAATGDGDVMMRFLPSFLAVEGLRQGLNVQDAALNAIQRIAKFYPDFSGGLIVVAQNEQYAAACHGMPQFPFIIGNVDNGSYTTFMQNVTCTR